MNARPTWWPCPALLFLLASPGLASAAPPAREFVAHQEDVVSLAYDPDGKLLASADVHGLVLLRDAVSGRLVRTLGNGIGDAPRLAFSPNGKLLAACGGGLRTNKGGLNVWDTQTGKLLLDVSGEYVGFGGIAFSPDGSLLAAGDRKTILGRSALRLWETTTWREKPAVASPNSVPAQLSFSPDGKRLIGGSSDSLHVWEVATGKQLLDQRPGASALAFHPEGKLLASVDGAVVSFRDLEGGKPETVKLNGQGRTVAFSPDGKILAVGGHSLQLLDVASRTLGRRLREQPTYGGLAFTPDGKRLAAGVGNDVLTFEVATGKELSLFPGLNLGTVTVLAWAAGGRHAASSGFDRRVRLWDVETGGTTAVFPVPGAVARVVVSADAGRVAAVTLPGQDKDAKSVVKAWDVGTGKELLAVPLDGKPNQLFLAISPDGKRLALAREAQTGAGFPPITTTPEPTLVWDLDRPGEPVKLPGDGPVAFSPDGRLLARSLKSWVQKEGSKDGFSRELRTEVRIGEVETGKDRFAPVNLGGVYLRDITFSTDGARLLALFTISDNSGLGKQKLELHSLDTQTGKQLLPPVRFPDVNMPRLLTLAPTGTAVAAVVDQTNLLRVYEGRHGTLLQERFGKKDRPAQFGVDRLHLAALAFSPDGQHLLAVTQEPNRPGSLRVLAVPPSHLETVYDSFPGPLTALAITPDGKQFAAAGLDGKAYLHTLGAKEKPAIISALPGPVAAVAFTPDGKSLGCAGGRSGRAGIVNLVPLTPGPPQPIAVNFKGAAHALSLSPDGRLLAVSGDNAVVVVDRTTLRTVRGLLHEHPMLTVAFHPDSRQLASGGFGRIWIGDAVEGKTIRHLDIPALPSALAYSPDGSLLAAAASDGVVRIWDVRMGKETARLQGHSGRAWCLAWDHGGKMLASGGGELEQPGEIVLWEVATGRRLLEMAGHHGPVRGLTFHPDGRLFSAGWDGTVKEWRPPGTSRRSTEPTALAARWRNDGKELVLGLRDGFPLFVGDPKWTDYTVEVEAMATGGQGELNVLVRASGAGQNTRVILGGWDNRFHGFLVARPGSPTLELLPLSGRPGNAVPASTERMRWYTIRVDVRGETAEVFLDGKSLMKTTALPQKQGNIGLNAIATSARFRNLKVTGPDGKTLLDKLPTVSAGPGDVTGP